MKYIYFVCRKYIFLVCRKFSIDFPKIWLPRISVGDLEIGTISVAQEPVQNFWYNYVGDDFDVKCV